MLVVSGFCRTCVINLVLAQSPADYARRPNVPPESPTLCLSHLQFEALLTASRQAVDGRSEGPILRQRVLHPGSSRNGAAMLGQ